MSATGYLWCKALHIIFMVTWFAGLFYLPRLFVYHANTQDAAGHARFVIMERKLFAIMTLGAGLTVFFGLGLISMMGMQGAWLHAKLSCVALLLAYHGYCYKIMQDFCAQRNQRSHVWFRWFNEIPALLLMAIVILVVVKPF